MKKQNIKNINQFLAWFFCIAILSQNGVKSPVLCFEKDGHVNIEADCNICCKIPKSHKNNHQVKCDDCIDIYLWNYNPNLQYIANAKDSNENISDFTQIIIIQEPVPKYTSNFQFFDPPRVLIPPIIKSTVLLI